MKTKIKILNLQKKVHINKKTIKNLVERILKIKGVKKVEVDILFVAKNRIRTLNKKFRKKDTACDVLAFRMHEGKDAHLHPEILGDVVVCPEIAQRYARIYNTTTKREIYLYLIHGLLHLLGYDDTNRQSRLTMEKEQAHILRKIVH